MCVSVCAHCSWQRGTQSMAWTARWQTGNWKITWEELCYESSLFWWVELTCVFIRLFLSFCDFQLAVHKKKRPASVFPVWKLSCCSLKNQRRTVVTAGTSDFSLLLDCKSVLLSSFLPIIQLCLWGDVERLRVCVRERKWQTNDYETREERIREGKTQRKSSKVNLLMDLTIIISLVSILTFDS